MKKLIALLTAFCLLCCLSGCAILGLTTGLVNGVTESLKSSSSGTAAQPASTLSDPAPAPDPEPEPEPNVVQLKCTVTATRCNVYTDVLGPRVQVMAELTNGSDVNIYLSDIAYDLLDADDHLIETRDTTVSIYPKIIAPGESAYICETIGLDEKPAGKIYLNPRGKASYAEVPLIRYPITDEALKVDRYDQLKVTGFVENDTDEDERLVTVAAILFNADDVCIGILTDHVNIAAGQKVGFSCSSLSLPNSVTEQAVTHMTVLAYPLQYQF